MPAWHRLPWALLTSLLKTDMTWTKLPGCCPLSGGGLAAELEPRSELCAGSSCQEHHSHWKGGGSWEAVSHICWNEHPQPLRLMYLLGYKAAGFVWVRELQGL